MTSLDKQTSVADDGHITRIVRLETQMDHVTSILAALQRTQDQHYQMALAQFEHMRNRIDQLNLQTANRFEDMRNRIDQVHLHTLERIDRLQDRMDRNTRWLVGIMLANISATIGILARVLQT